jgi:hypothetical protein
VAFSVTARHVRTTGTSASQTSGASDSVTPTADSLFLVCWTSQNNASATAPSFQTPVGGGLTYTQVRTAGDATSYAWDGDNSFRVASAVYRANIGSSPSAFTVTVDSSPTTATFYYGGPVCLDLTGHDTTSPIVQTAIAGGTKSQGNTESGTVTFSSAPTPGNLILVVFGSGADGGGGFASPTAGAGKTFTTVRNQTAAYCQTGVFYRVADGSESTTITCSDLGQQVGNYSAIAIEIKAAPGAPVDGSGAAVAPTATVSGNGNVGDPVITGTGGAVAPAAVVAGEGDVPPLVFPYITQILGSGNQQYPADQNGDPILVKGDVIWAFPGNAGRWNGGDWQADITAYLDIRREQGFNLLMIGALGSTQNGTISDTGQTFDGVLPFSGGNGVLNNAYWERVDYILEQAANRGITVLLNVAYSYDMDDGALENFSNANYTTYGTNLGNRYKNAPNLIWGVGGDYFDTQTTQLGNLFTAIEATGDTHLKSVQNYPESTSRRDIFNNGTNNTGTTWSDWNFVYSYNVTYDGVEYAYDETSPICVIWGDGHFDQDTTQDRKVMRDLIWWALSSGARGHIYGSEGTWNWGSTALSNVEDETVPSTDLATYWDTFTGLEGWHQLVPDTDSSFVVSGRGTHAAAISSGGSGGEYNASDPQDQYVTASVTPDGKLAVVYFPVDRTITVDDTELGAGYTVTWIDPTNGNTTPETPASTYSPTGNNALGGPDWLLVFQSSSEAEITGSGNAAAPAASVSGSGGVEAAGSGSVSAAPSQVSGAAGVEVAGSGTVAAADATVSGTAGVVAGGSGAVTASAAVASGSASVEIVGVGSVAAPAATTAGVAGVEVTGSGELAASAAVSIGSGSIGAAPVTGTGTAGAPAAELAGVGGVEAGGSGSLSAATATTTGTGGVEVTGSGAASATAAAVDGSGNIGAAPVTGAGSLAAPVAATAGVGTVWVTGTGSATATPAEVDGAGSLGVAPITGSGTAAATPASASGSGGVLIDGNGTLVTADAIITAAGAVVISGGGSVTAPAARVGGGAFAAITYRPYDGTTPRPNEGTTPRL